MTVVTYSEEENKGTTITDVRTVVSHGESMHLIMNDDSFRIISNVYRAVTINK